MVPGSAATVPPVRRASLPRFFVAALALSLVVAPPVKGQEWTLDLYGGHVAYDLATTNLGETSALVGIRYRDPDRRWLYLSSGIPFGSDDSLWGAGGLGTRLATDAGSLGLESLDLGSVELGADLSGQGFVYRDPKTSSVGTGGVLDIRPLAALVGDRTRLELRSGWVGYGSTIDSLSVTRGLLDSDASLYFSPVSALVLSGTVRHVRADEGSYTFGGGRVSLQAGPVRFWGSAGGWSSDAIPTTEWGAGVSYRVDPAGRTVLSASIREDAADPIYWNSPRQRWSIGVSRTLGGGGRTSALPGSDRPGLDRPGSGPDIADGRVRIRISKTHVGASGGSGSEGRNAPSVAGEFTGWELVPMEDEGDHWSATFQLDPGVYRYAFRSPDGEWFVPESVPGRRPDGFGGYVAVLVVS